MLKNKFIKVAGFSFVLLIAVWAAAPKVYLQELLHPHHSAIQIASETKVQSQSSENPDFNEYNKPVYFDLFKFLSSFIPVKQ